MLRNGNGGKGGGFGEMGVSASRGPENGRLSEGMTARKARTSAKENADPSLRSATNLFGLAGKAKATTGGHLWFPTLDAKSKSRMGHPRWFQSKEKQRQRQRQILRFVQDDKFVWVGRKGKGNDWRAFVVSHPRRKERV